MNSTLEMKVDTIIDALMSNTDEGYDRAMAKLQELRSLPAAGPVRDVEDIIEQILLEVGVPSNLTGHRYLLAAIKFCTKCTDNHPTITKVIYPEVAKMCGTTASRVERGIRHAIEVAWERADLNALRKYFGNTINPKSYKLSNSEFIWRLTNVARKQLQQD